jgi:hypothetical protein
MDDFDQTEFKDLIPMVVIGATEEAQAQKKPQMTGQARCDYVDVL